MPDIGKLEELCRILNLSLDQLLGAKRQVANVQKIIDYAGGKVREVPPLEAIGDAAPLMEPDMLSHLARDVQEEEIAPEDLLGLAPFLGREVLGVLTLRIKAVTLDELCGLAPFLDKETLKALAEKITDEEIDLEGLCGVAPFLDKETVISLAERIPSDRIILGELCGLAPFMEREDLERLIGKRYR